MRHFDGPGSDQGLEKHEIDGIKQELMMDMLSERQSKVSNKTLISRRLNQYRSERNLLQKYEKV